MSEFKNKLVAIMNKSGDPGKMMNALAHMCIAFGARIGEEPLQLVDYIDADQQIHPKISKMPFIILQASGNKIRTLRQEAQQSGIEFAEFTDTMTIGSWQEQVERTRQTPEADLQYYGIVLNGPWDQVSALTKKFSLWR